MGTNTVTAFGALGRDDVLFFLPEQLTVVKDPKHPLYDERVHLPIDEGMVLNIMFQGVLKPIIVSKDGEKEGSPVVLVWDGRQRVKNCAEANRRLREQGKEEVRIPAVRRRGDGSSQLGVMISANEHNAVDSPLIKARKCARYIQMGHSEEEASVLFGRNVPTIKSWMALLDCGETVQKAVESGDCSVQVAIKLSSLSQDEQVTALGELKAAGTTRGASGVRAAEEKIGKPPGPRLRSRKHIEAMIEIFAEAKEDLPDPRRILRYILGDDAALGKKWHPEEKVKASAAAKES